MSGVTASRPRAKTELSRTWGLDAGDYVTCVDLSRDGAACAIGNGAGQLIAVDLTSGEPCWSTPAHAEGVLEVAFSPDCEVIASCGQDEAAHLYTRSGRRVCELPGTGGWVEHLAWTPDGRHLAITSGRHVRVYTRDGKLVREVGPLPSTATAVAWDAAGRTFAASSYGGVLIWTLSDDAAARQLAFKGSLLTLAWSPDGKVIACTSQDGSVHFWRLASGQDAAMSGYPFRPRALAWDAHSKLLATAGDASITVWDFGGKGPEGTAPLQLEGHKGLCTKLAFSPRKGTLASAGQDMSVLLWEPRRGTKPVRFAFLEDEVTALVWHPQHRGLLGADASGNVAYWMMDSAR